MQEAALLFEQDAGVLPGARKALVNREARPEVIAFTHEDLVHERRLHDRQREPGWHGVAARGPGLAARPLGPRGANPLDNYFHKQILQYGIVTGQRDSSLSVPCTLAAAVCAPNDHSRASGCPVLYRDRKRRTAALRVAMNHD